MAVMQGVGTGTRITSGGGGMTVEQPDKSSITGGIIRTEDDLRALGLVLVERNGRLIYEVPSEPEPEPENSPPRQA